MPDASLLANLPTGKAASGGGKASDHLANERTFLAWVRTCIAIVSLGFVVAKFGVWLEEMARQTAGSGQPPAHAHEHSSLIGAGLMVAGAGLVPLAAWHHYRVGRDIEAGRAHPSYWLIVVVTVLVLVLTAVLVGYLVASTGSR